MTNSDIDFDNIATLHALQNRPNFFKNTIDWKNIIIYTFAVIGTWVL